MVRERTRSSGAWFFLSSVSAPATFGVISGTVGTPREMQLAIKLYY